PGSLEDDNLDRSGAVATGIFLSSCLPKPTELRTFGLVRGVCRNDTVVPDLERYKEIRQTQDPRTYCSLRSRNLYSHHRILLQPAPLFSHPVSGDNLSPQPHERLSPDYPCSLGNPLSRGKNGPSKDDMGSSCHL